MTTDMIKLQESAHCAARVVHLLQALPSTEPEHVALLDAAKVAAASLLRRYAASEPNERNARLATERANEIEGKPNPVPQTAARQPTEAERVSMGAAMQRHNGGRKG